MKSLKEKLVQEGLIRRQAGMDMRAKIEAWLKEHNIKNYTINKDSIIDVNGTVDLSGYEEKQLPDYIRFGKVTRGFYCGGCPKLKSLEGVPQKVGGNFYCGHCPELESLKECPQEVGGDFWCRFCGKRFTIDDVKKISDVEGDIKV